MRNASAAAASEGPSDPHLSALMAAWPKLTDKQRRQVAALVGSIVN